MRLLKAALALAVGLFAVGASAQDYPAQPIRIIVPYAAGGTTDITARTIADSASRLLGQRILVENKPGASGTIGIREAIAAKGDGYTLVFANSTQVILPLVQKDAGYDIFKDLTPVSLVVNQPPIGIVANPSVPANTLAEFIAYVKANPGKVTYASDGIGSLTHLAGEEFKRQQGGLQMTHIPYQGTAPMLQAVMGGDVGVGFMAMITAQEHIRSGALKAYANLAPRRFNMLPDLQTTTELGMGDFVVETWSSIWAPAETPIEIREKLAAAIKEGLGAPDVQEKMEKLGFVTVASTPSELETAARGEFDRWKVRIEALGDALKR